MYCIIIARGEIILDFDLVIPSLEYKDEIMDFLSEVKKVDACKPWQYAGMASLEASHSYNDWVVEKANQ